MTALATTTLGTRLPASRCANYLYRTGGVLHRGSSAWGARALLRELVRGPDEMRARLRERTGCASFAHAWLYGELMTEGAVFADDDARRLIAFGGDEIRRLRTLQLAYEPMLQRAWPDWRVSYATGGWGEIAAEAGVAIKPFDDLRVPDEWPLDHDRAPGGFVVVTQIADGRARHVHLAACDAGAFTLGPALLDRLPTLVSHPLEARSFDATAGLVIDRDMRRIHVWAAEMPALLYERLCLRWPGWDVVRISSVRDHARLASEPAPVLAMVPLTARVMRELSL